MRNRIVIFLLFSIFIIHNLLFIIPVNAASPIPSGCGTSHENAMCNFNILEPEELTSNIKIEEPNILQQLLNKITQITTLLGFKPIFVQNYHPRSELQNQSELPPELKPSGPPEQQLPEFLNDDGVYGNSLPEFQGIKDTKEWEGSYEDAYLPENIDPITK